MSNLQKIAFVCVQNAGRSQMAMAFARREKENRSAPVTILTGGTNPADHVHPEVVVVMKEKGIDLSNQTPIGITAEEIAECDLVITMGCGAENVCPAIWSGESRDWALDDPDGEDLDAVRVIRDDIENRVKKLFDKLSRTR